ncbi:metalloprotease 1 [Fusarium longipes]|uniref:Metalloprotease 1 n=1 Tax=Fusarium longipes TaxID=694270 RepID=A0A395T3Y8_9HYPO|nr:metalloprotease 1 [Fusarium longipes]
MLLQFYLITSLSILVANAAVEEPIIFPISNALCPLIPPSTTPGNACGPYTHQFCDTPTASLSCCMSADSDGLSLLPFTGYVDPPKDYVVDVENYALYHLLHLEYLVEFSKNPMPFQTPLSLPYCGINPDPNSKRELEPESFQRRRILPRIKIGGTLGRITEEAKHFVKEVEKGVGSLHKPPKRPKFLPRPICIPKTIQVPVHFTVFTTNLTTSTLIDNAALERQLNVTNEAFKPLGISFFISSLSYHIGREWERFTHSKNVVEGDYYTYSQRIKAENRYGGNDEVNIWIVEEIDAPRCNGDSVVWTDGYCTLGRNVNTAGHVVDGCAITIGSLPGVVWRTDGPGTGSTLTHELGHWFDLDHIFPEKAGADCAGESDLIEDTYQFPHDGNMFEPEQRRCCSTKKGNKVEWGLCADGSTYNVTNYMSYSRIKGKIISGNANGTAPWTTEQRAHMFASYFTHRRSPGKTVDSNCNSYPVFFEAEPASKLDTRAFVLDERSLSGFALRGYKLLKQGPRLLEQLIKRCSSPPNPNLVEAINIYTGEIVTCDDEGNCQSPSTGPTCPDGTSPPCQLDQHCLDGSAPPCKEVCRDGTAPPCTGNGGSTCPDGLPSSCLGGSVEVEKPGTNKETQRPTCPAGCNVHDNKCDKTTAPTCIFPDPRVTNPRSACACRPGFKASGYRDTDTTKHWRLPIPGQEHRVWVAEGVKCDTLCTVSTGVGSCREVSEVAEECVRN